MKVDARRGFARGVLGSNMISPSPLVPPLQDNARLVSLVSEVTGADVKSVRKKLLASERNICACVPSALSKAGVKPFVWSEGLARFYEQTDAFIYELAAWNRNANKVSIRTWIADFLSKCSEQPVDVLVVGDGLGVDSTFLAQRRQRVHYFEVSEKALRLSSKIFALNPVK